jgi:hypothetical protein
VLEDANAWDERMEDVGKHFKGKIKALRLLRTWTRKKDGHLRDRVGE